MTMLVADDGTVHRLRQPHRVVARLVDGSDEIVVQFFCIIYNIISQHSHRVVAHLVDGSDEIVVQVLKRTFENLW